MTLDEANRLVPATRLRVLGSGLSRHGLEGEQAEGSYVSQFDSPHQGRLVVVHLREHGNFGFRLDELERPPAGD